MNQAISSLQTQIEQFEKYVKTFEFLFSLERFKYANDDNLLRYCKNLEQFLRHYGNSDIDGHELYMELMMLKCSLPIEAKRVIDVPII